MSRYITGGRLHHAPGGNEDARGQPLDIHVQIVVQDRINVRISDVAYFDGERVSDESV
jgi:hypothetical protein